MSSASGTRRCWGPRRLVLLAVNVVSTLLTLFTGFRENPVVVLVTDRYDLVRSCLCSPQPLVLGPDYVPSSHCFFGLRGGSVRRLLRLIVDTWRRC